MRTSGSCAEDSDQWLLPGRRVRVLLGAASRYSRTPWHARGSTGVVVAVHGCFADPDALAHGEPAPLRRLVRVRLDLAGPDLVEADISAAWLEPLEAPHGRA